MPAPRPFPPYPKRPLKHSGGARIKIRQRSYYLGKHGTESSYREYERLRAEHATGMAAPSLPDAAGLTVDELVAAWLAAEPRGKDHPQVQRICRACVPLSRLFGLTRANEFRANRLRGVQEALISQSWMTPEEAEKLGDWSRGYINRNIQRIVLVFRWAESTELIPMGIAEHLRTVPMLRANDRRVRSIPPRKPVDWETQVKPCLPFLAPVVKAMVIVQFHAAMRPSEVCHVKRREVDQASVEGVWLYRPSQHKGTWREDELVKVIGPVAQRAMAPWLMAAETDDFVFPPAKRRNGAKCYQENGYAQAVRRAIRQAGVEPWCLYQLRHSAAHAAEIVGGLEGAAAMLGQRSLETTKIYASKQRLDLAIATAKKIG